ncbi:MAG TPA: Asp-tRNA(Asn)/Glu-tRNA(Gln) amidotransferase subunit GatA [Tepidisphaeraceae bacterium]|nr:Asp-tRNA(Asn)/Glu-tRNA(Gln) amidotransferase subunit GatA [Tepidisphaeraceae bacterium]
MTFDTLIAAKNAVASGQVSAVELVRATLDRIAAVEPDIGAFNSVFNEDALKQAKRIDDAKHPGPLAGVPIAVKDNICTSHGKTTCSSKILANFHAPYDATVIKKLQSAGAIIIGKTNCDEFAMGSSTENSAFKLTHNPWDVSRVPGGSSGGSAASVCAGLSPGALGSDTGGSIRQPAALCGIVGIKPTYGRVSRYGLVAYASSLDQIGTFGRTVADAALQLQVIAGHDPMDSTSFNELVPDYSASLEQPLKGLRIGIAKEYNLSEGLDLQVRQAIDAAIETYRSLGAVVVDVSLPNTSYGIAAYYLIATCEASSNLARYDGVHFGHRTADKVSDIVELFSKSRAEGFGPEVQRRIMLGTYALSSGYYDAFYVRALKIRRLIKNDFDRAFEQCDVIACPSSPVPAFKIGEKTDDPLSMYLCDVFTVTANIAGIPGISIPAGFTDGSTSDGKPLPIGLQLLGPVFSEEKLLRAARMFETATEFHSRRPSIDH